MIADPWPFYAVALPAALAAGVIRGFAGFGGPLLLVPTLNLYLPPAVSITIVIWVDLFANLRLLPEARHRGIGRVIAPLVIGTALTMPLGTYLLVTLDPSLMKQVISVAILCAAIALLSGWRYRGSAGVGTYGAVGAVSGMIMGATSIAVATALFLNAGAESAAVNRANFIVWVFFATLLLLGLLTAHGTLGYGSVAAIALLAPAYLLGTVGGSRLHMQVSEQVVRQSVLVLIVIVALTSLLV